MFAFRTLLAILACTLATSAAPLHNHHRRNTCKPRSSGSAVSHIATGTVASVSSTAVASASAQSSSIKAPEPSAHASSVHHSSSTHKASSTSSSVQESATGSSGSTPSALKKLFPVSSSKSWTTSPQADDALPLNDQTLGVTKLLSALSHNYVKAPDGKYSVQAHYPKGSYTYGHDPQGGFSFYATGPDNFNLDNAKEATLSYSVLFEDDFDFNLGGKLPGFYGGNDDTVATSCSGGRRDDRCFSTRFMFRTGGKGELYTYLPPDYSANKALCKVAPESDCNDVYGASVGRGSFYFKAGTRTTIGQRVKLNDVGKENGELELFVEGKSIFTVKGLVYRNSDSGKIRGIQMQTFFGGSSSEYASPKSQNTWFSDFSVAVTESF